MSKKVRIDTDECIGYKTCAELCPEVFGFDEEAENAVVIHPGGGPVYVEEAIEACLVECIHWEED